MPDSRGNPTEEDATQAWLQVEPVELAASPTGVLRALAERPYPLALTGSWSDGGAVVTSDPICVAAIDEDPFAVVDRLPSVVPSQSHPRAIGGGWFGYLGYRLARRLERIKAPEPQGERLPDFHLAFYDHLLRYDEPDARWYFEALITESKRDSIRRWRDTVLEQLGTAAVRTADARLDRVRWPDRVQHVVAVERCVTAIRRGDIFQANVCTRMAAELRGSSAEAWARLVEALHPARAAYLAGPWGSVLSLSPELFLRRRGTRVLTAPIKGTRPRSGVADERREAEVLRASAKDEAENVMIVDLMRNDLGRVCVPGTVRVPTLLSVEPHPGVWHLVSYVCGELPPEVSNGALLRATFPPGSVTGAPKVRAIEIIDELETVPRGVYTGAVGYASPVAGLELNVAIRTFEVRDGIAWLGVGGGVTAESTPVEEWVECLVKARPLLQALGAPAVPASIGEAGSPALADRLAGVFETMLAVDGEVCELADHLSRLRRSCWEVYRHRLDPQLADLVRRRCAPLRGTYRIRVRVCPATGAAPTVEVAAQPSPLPVGEQAGLCVVPQPAPGGLERHKFVDRRWLEGIEASCGPGETAVLLDDDELLESTRDSLFVVREGTLCAAPLDGRILPGVTRQIVLDLADDRGIRSLVSPIDQRWLISAEGMFLTNSLHGIRWVRRTRQREWSQPDATTQALSALLLRRWRLAPFWSRKEEATSKRGGGRR
jgi:para-aminobenzoate synthetase / 4-amino-4-deoxychorismate lyase